MNAANNIPIQNWTPLNKTSAKIWEGFFDKPLYFQREFTYQTHNDFGKIIKKLLFSTPKKGFSSHFFENIQEIGKREGFSVIQSEYPFYPVRDAKCKAADGCWVEPNCNTDTLLKAVGRNKKRQYHTKRDPSALTNSPIFGGTIGVVARDHMHRQTSDGIKDKKEYQDGRIYFEGGNCFYLTNQNGVGKYLVGEGLITVTHQTLRMDKWFADTSQSSTSKINEMLIQSKYNKGPLNKLYLGNQIPKKILEEGEVFKKDLSKEKVQETLQEMLSIGNITCIKFDKKQDIEKGYEIAAEYLAQEKFVKNDLFGEDLHISGEHIVSVSQLAYHLDVLLTPGPCGTIFIQDYPLALKTLGKILDNAQDLQLTSRDIGLLKDCITEMTSLSSELGPLMLTVKKQLEEAGFKLIPTPGAFFNRKSYDRKNLDGESLFTNVNFFNAITGYSKITQHPYIILPGTDVGDRLGEVLMDAYSEFLRAQICPELAVYYVGRNPTNLKDYSEAFFTTNRGGSQLGPHCLSFELDTEKNQVLQSGSF